MHDGVALRLEGAGKRYPGSKDGIWAVRDVSFSVPERSVTALLGRNGAGKSTLVRMISTLITPTEGRIEVAGVDTAEDEAAARRRIGVVLGGERSVYWKLTGRQNLAFFSALKGLRGQAKRDEIDRVLDAIDLTSRADDYVETYSTGMRQRLVIARALLGSPPLLIMDEPTAGLDPHVTASLQELILSLRDHGHAVLITTHHIEEAELIADDVVVIDHGVLRATGSPRALTAAVGASHTIECSFAQAHAETAARAAAASPAPVAVVAEEVTDTQLHVTLTGSIDEHFIPAFTQAMIAAGLDLRGLTVSPVTLRRAFLDLTEK